MNDVHRQRWEDIARTYSRPFNERARQILDHGRDDFELQWLLVDFAELCIRYLALILLGETHANSVARQALFDDYAPDKLRLAPFGGWATFVADMQDRFGKRGITIPLLLSTRAKKLVNKVREYVLPRRNGLAHGAADRFAISQEKVDSLSELVLQVAEKLPELFSKELAWDGQKAQLQFFDARPIDLYPFIKRTENGDEPLLYAHIDRKNCAVFHSSAGAVADSDLGTLICDHLAGGQLPFDEKHPSEISGAELLERSAALLGKLQAEVNADYFCTDRCFSQLPQYAGRPSWANHLADLINDPTTPFILHLYGRRGCGKRKLLTDLLVHLQQAGHIVAPIWLSKLPPDGLTVAFNRALQLSGNLIDLTNAVEKLDANARLVVLLGDFTSLMNEPTRHAQIRSVLLEGNHPDGLQVLLVSDAMDSIQTSWGSGPSFVQLAIPPMEAGPCEEFYRSVTARSGRMPLTDWELLPPPARQYARSPADLVLLCERYDGQSVPRDFSILRHRQHLWNSHVPAGNGKLQPPEMMKRRSIIDEMARHILNSGQRTVRQSSCPTLGESRKDARRARDSLEQLGFISGVSVASESRYSEAVVFTEYDWLVRALIRVLPLPSDNHELGDQELDDVLAECDRLGPVCDALAVWAFELIEQNTESFRRLFSRILRSRPKCCNKLVESLLIRAYHVEWLFEDLLTQAIATEDEAVLGGCAGAAQQLITGGSGAERDGVRIYRDLLAVTARREFTQLEAVLLNEYAEHCLEPSNLKEQLACFEKAIANAQLHGLPQLEHVAVNNWSRAALAGIDLNTIASSTEPCARVQRVIDRLESLCQIEADIGNWHRLSYSHHLIARAYAIDSNDEAARDHLLTSIEICQAFGEAADVAREFDSAACYFADRGDFLDAIAQHDQAINWMRIASDRDGEAGCLANRALTRSRHPDVVEPHRCRLFADALNDFQTAKRLLAQLPSGPHILARQAEVWEGMARLFERIEELDQAIVCTECSEEKYHAAGLKADAQRMREFIGYLKKTK
jgi:tetratricopeptide (TPR) repeat protein